MTQKKSHSGTENSKNCSLQTKNCFSLLASLHYYVSFRSGYKSRVFLVPVCLFALLYNLPKFFELRLERVSAAAEVEGNATAAAANATAATQEEDDEDNYELSLRATELRKNKLYVRVYLIWMNLFIQV